MKKSMFVIAMLILASSYCVADDNIKVGNVAERDSSLQANAIDPGAGYQFQVGDTIVISKKMEHYLTGEEPSEWVYYVRHIIQQIGGKRFPQGMLIKGIYSWIGPEDALLVGATERTPAADNRIKRDSEQVRTQQQQLDGMTDEEKKAIEERAKAIGTRPLDGEGMVKPDKDNDNVITGEGEVEPIKDDEPIDEIIAEQDTTPVDTFKRKSIDRFTIGVRAGMASLMENTDKEMKNRIGFDAILDLQYAHYWSNRKDHLFGILVGVSAGYAQGGLKENNWSSETFKRTDASSGQVFDYTVTADKVKETNRQIQLEVPLMFSMILNNGFFLNVGPRIMLPVYTPYTEKFNNAVVDAYNADYNVHAPNVLASGVMNGSKFKGKTDNKMKINILLGLELGYEWRFQNGNSLGLGAYANYGWSTYKQKDKNSMLVDVNTDQTPAIVDVNSAANTFTEKMGYLDAGVKLAYHFNWWRNKK